MKISLRHIFVALCLSIFTLEAQADVADASYVPQGSATYAEIPVSAVVLYVYKPDFKFKVTGVFEAHGMAGGDGSLLDQLDLFKMFDAPPGEKEDLALALQALKVEAAKHGIQHVLIIRSQQVRVSNNATERQIRAAGLLKVE